MEWLSIAYYTLCGAILVTMAFGIALSLFIPSLDKWNKRYFITLFSLLFLCAVVCFLSLIFYSNPTRVVVEKVLYCFEWVLLAVPVFMPAVFLLHCCGEKITRSALFMIIVALLGGHFVFVVVTQFTTGFYYVTPDGQFVRGPLWALSMMPTPLILVLSIAGTIKRKKLLPKKYFTGLLVYMLPMTVVLIAHMFVSIETFVVFGMTLFALIMYGLILSDNMEKYMLQQREIANQRASIMVLQMRPHFIYNSLMGIYYLCDRDPKKAKEVTLDFTTYLRKNFAAIANEETIAFTEELEHTRAYLAIEQAQFEDNLFVDFDTPYTAFRQPALTLQPIVENAVVHGLRASKDPIHISVATRKRDNAVEIIVEDDGPGFQKSDNNEPHIALNNIMQRLELMVNGTLVISAREGGGTSVKVTIPLTKAEE